MFGRSGGSGWRGGEFTSNAGHKRKEGEDKGKEEEDQGNEGEGKGKEGEEGEEATMIVLHT